jgi:hypothetical protein
MRCEREFLQSVRKHADHTEFACYIRNHTLQPVTLRVPFGQMENRPRLTDEEYALLIDQNRSRYSAKGAKATDQLQNVAAAGIGAPPQDLF